MKSTSTTVTTPPPNNSGQMRLASRCLNTLALALSLAASNLIIPQTSVAQEQPAKKLTFNHKPLTTKELSTPGSSVLLTTELRGDRSIVHRVRLLAVADGRLMEPPVKRAYLNSKDIPTFEFEIHAPLASLSYQFLLSDPGVDPVSSERVSLERNCLPFPTRIDTAIDPELSQSEQIRKLADTSAALEVELRQYEAAIREVRELQELLPR